MKTKKIKKVSKVAVLLYVLAIVVFGITLYNAYTCTNDIASMVEQGFVVADNLTDVINYYILNVTPYVFYTICLGVLGYIIQKINRLEQLKAVGVVEVEEIVEEETDEDESYETLVKQLKTEE